MWRLMRLTVDGPLNSYETNGVKSTIHSLLELDPKPLLELEPKPLLECNPIPYWNDHPFLIGMTTHSLLE
jgi:hypothetical protein